MRIGEYRKNLDTGRMTVDILDVNDIEIAILHEVIRNYDEDDEPRKTIGGNIKQVIDEAWDKVR